MKGFFGKFFKYLLLILYPVVVAVLIAVSVLLFMKTRDVNTALTNYNEIFSREEINGSPRENIANASEDLKDIVDELFVTIDQKNSEIEELKNKVESEQKDGFGEISGSILPFVSQGQDFNRYQRVCAELKDNENKQYCVSVSAIGKTYTLVVPEGEYYVFAQLQDDPSNTSKAYYTEYIKCAQDSDVDSCDGNLSANKALVVVESGGSVENVEPIDWQIEGLNVLENRADVE